MADPDEPISIQFEAFVSRLIVGGVASPSDLVGCSGDEIEQLERKYDVVLPTSYRLFLRRMGHWSGRLFTHDHVSVNYADVLRMTEEQVRSWKESPEPQRVTFTPNALVILSRLGEQWLCLRCAGGDDVPVLYYNESGGEMQVSHSSGLETWREEAEDAIASGYY